jgi:hypothetical protein
MPIAEIPFPNISITNRIVGNTRQAQQNQQQLREEAEESGRLDKIGLSL